MYKVLYNQRWLRPVEFISHEISYISSPKMSASRRATYILRNNRVKNMKLRRTSKHFFFNLEYVTCMVSLSRIISVSKVIEMSS